MKFRKIFLVFLLICSVLIVYTSNIGKAIGHIDDHNSIFYDWDSGETGSEGKELDNLMDEYFKSSGVLVHLITDYERAIFEQEFESLGRNAFNAIFMQRYEGKGNPTFNVLIYHLEYFLETGEPGNRYKIGYFYSHRCGMFKDEMEKLASKEMSAPLEVKDFSEIVKNVIKTIENVREIVDENCILNECNLITQGKDARYSGYTCESRDNNKPEDHHYTCSNQYGKKIKCMYNDEFYKIADEISKFKVEKIFLVTSVGGDLPTDEDKTVEYDDEVMLYVISKTTTGEYYSGDPLNNPPFQKAKIGGEIVNVKKSPVPLKIIFKRYGQKGGSQYKRGDISIFKEIGSIDLTNGNVWKMRIDIKSQTLGNNPLSEKTKGSGTNWFGAELVLPHKASVLKSNILRVSRKGNLKYKDLVPSCEKDNSCDSKEAKKAADYINTMIIYHTYWGSNGRGNDINCKNVWFVDCADLHISTAWHYGLIKRDSPPCSSYGATNLGMMDPKITEERTEWEGDYLFKQYDENAIPSEIQEVYGDYYVSEEGSGYLKTYSENGEYFGKLGTNAYSPFGIYFDKNTLYLADAVGGTSPDRVDVYSYDGNEAFQIAYIDMKGPYDSYHDEIMDSDPISLGVYNDNLYVLTQDWETILKYSIEEKEEKSYDVDIRFGERKTVDNLEIEFNGYRSRLELSGQERITNAEIQINNILLYVDIGTGAKYRHLDVKVNSLEKIGDKYKLSLKITIKKHLEFNPKNWDGKNTNRIFVGEADDGKNIDYVFTEPDPGLAGIDTHKEKSMVIKDDKIYVSLGINKIKVYDADRGRYITKFGEKLLSNDIGRMKTDGEELFIADTRNKAIIVTDFKGKFIRKIEIKDETQTYEPYTLALGKNLIAVGAFISGSKKKGLLFIDRKTGKITKKYFQEESPLKKVNKQGEMENTVIKIGLGENELHPGDMLVTKGSYYRNRFGHTTGFFADSTKSDEKMDVKDGDECIKIAEEECKDYGGMYNYLYEEGGEERACYYTCYGNGILDENDIIFQYGIDYFKPPYRFVIRKWSGF